MNIRPFYIAPVLPEELKHLKDIAMNLWYSWNWEAVHLFIRMDEQLWEEVYQNPVAMLGRVSQARLNELARDDSFVASLERIYNSMQAYLNSDKWYQKVYSDQPDMLAAYFSCEFGLAEALPVYSGGLGILSGDHLKTASDLGIPLVGIGLLYRQGYFRQRLNADGFQLEEYPENDWYQMSVNQEKDKDGNTIVVSVEMAETTVYAQVWRVQVGAVRLFLLDTNFARNNAWARQITTQLYGGDRDMRIRQELLLGIGGVRALEAIGLQPTVYHLNEGHSAFLILERIRKLILEHKLSFKEAVEVVRSTNVFTTHTPVPAGNEQFDTGLLKHYLHGWIEQIGISWNDFIHMGRVNPNDDKELFGMTVFALRNSGYSNGVSHLHGEVSRGMWNRIWPNVPRKEVPITHITNGTHTRSWISHELGDLFESYLGPRFVQKPWEHDIWDRVERIPDVELWRMHQRRREHLVFFARKRLRHQIERRNEHGVNLRHAEEVLNPHALTIGFARRMATYKRANLLFTDLERLKKIITNSERPVQFIIAGKAHPHDIPAKEMIKRLFHIIHEEPFRSHFVFLENYDINVARYLVQGVDVWLNNPRRPLEASGTSGMKAAMNGGLNVSILDGWWDEGFTPEVGWAIGTRDSFDDPNHQDVVESEALYNCLENEVIPDFYDRDAIGMPRSWIRKMKNSIKHLGRQFNTHRMLEEYTDKLYIHAHHGYEKLQSNKFSKGKELAAWWDKVKLAWNQVKIENVETSAAYEELHVGDMLEIKVQTNLGNLNYTDVCVEVMYGQIDSKGEMLNGDIFNTDYCGTDGNGSHLFCFKIPCQESGQHGFSIRVRPNHPDLAPASKYEFITWG